MNQLYPWLRPYAQNWLNHGDALSHAWLMTGAEGIGKYQLARWMMQSLLCEEHEARPCGECVSCQWFLRHQHPDAYHCLPEDQSEALADGTRLFLSYEASDWIKIDAVRALQQKIYLPPHRGRAKVILIYPADLLTVATANALLKLLEEPPADTYFFLIAHRADRLLATLRSRCHNLPIHTPSFSETQTWCNAQEISPALLAESGGCPLHATDLKKWHIHFNTLQTTLFHPRSIHIDAWKQLLEKVTKAERRIALAYCLKHLHKMTHDWLCVLHGLSPRFFPSLNTSFQSIKSNILIHKVLDLDHTLNSLHKHSKHPLNTTWILEDVLHRYSQLEA